MPELPVVTGREAIRAFARVGFEEVHVKGSHHVLKKADHPHRLSVPVHGNKPLKKGTLRSLIRVAGITVEEFVSLLE
ncbi:MAG: type II toxin-antitoxin system HicA family toxin [Phycisphaerae bacterium]